MSKEKRIKVIDEHGAHGWAIREANERSGLKDLPLACALVEQESGFRNIFGCDYGPQSGHPPFCEDKVTKARVQALLKQSKNNGVGLTQLTSRDLVLKAEQKGGAHLPLNQCLVGFAYLHSLIQQLGKHRGIGAYNGGPGNPIDSYADSVEAKEKVWRRRLN